MNRVPLQRWKRALGAMAQASRRASEPRWRGLPRLSVGAGLAGPIHKPSPLTECGSHTSLARQKALPSTHSPAARVRRWSFDRFWSWISSPVVEKDSNLRPTSCEAALPTELHNRCGPSGSRTWHLTVQTIDGPYRPIPAARHVRQQRTDPDAAHRRGGPCVNSAPTPDL